MAWSFGDGFDLYAAVGDAANGYWDTASGATLTTGRFSGSQALQFTTATGPPLYVKSSATNDAVHHLAMAFQQTAAISGTTLGCYLELFDGATGQCSIVFRSDGAIVLTSGGPGGTALATYTGAFPVASTWYHFEIEVTINNTTGSFKVRKNGNSVDDFSASSLDTQNSANAYANKLQLSMNAPVSAHRFDDLFWRSDASSVAWLGDLRCHTRMPASDAAIAFSRTPTGVLTQTVTPGSPTNGGTTGAAYYTAFTATYDGTVTSVTVLWAVMGSTTTLKCAIFADSVGGLPGAVLASATSSLTPIIGNNVFTFSGVSIVKGVRYWVGTVRDGNGTWTMSSTNNAAGASGTLSLAAFPQANPVVSNPNLAVHMSWTYTATPANWQAVSESQQDALTSYVYSSTPGQEDFYGVSSIASTPATVIATTVRAYAQKSDAGSRTIAAQVKSGSTTVASTTTTLTTSGWTWVWRTDTVDPATGVAWTPTAVNNAQIGPKVIV
jgi:hypothetical protein